MATKAQMLQEAKDMQDAAKAEKAYNAAMTNTPAAPKPAASAPAKKFAKGGKIDGVAKRGKTRGKII